MTSRYGSVTGALLFVLLLLVQLGCGGDDDSAVTPATCMGAGCMCDPGNDCTCDRGADCKATCEQCSLTCEDGAKCNAEATAAVKVECNADSDCKGHGGTGSTLTCRDSSHCDLKAGASSVATCTDSSDCKINLGPGSTVDCMDSAHCDIKCDAGDCEVSCGGGTECGLNCGEAASAKPGTSCPDGRLICGTDC